MGFLTAGNLTPTIGSPLVRLKLDSAGFGSSYIAVAIFYFLEAAKGVAYRQSVRVGIE